MRMQMRGDMKLETIIVLFGIALQTYAGPGTAPIVSVSPLNNFAVPNAYQQRLIDEQTGAWQQQQAEIAAEKAAEQKAAQEAAYKADYDAAVEKLTTARNDATKALDDKYDPDIANLQSHLFSLKQKLFQLESQRGEAERVNAHLRAKQLFTPKDPWRSLDGHVYNAKDENWLQFVGTILEVKPNGILVRGEFGPPLEASFGEREFFVANFPIELYPMADGEVFTSNMCLVAHLNEKSSIYQYTNTTIDLRVNTVRKLDYGRIVTSPPPDLVQKWSNLVIVGDSNPALTTQIEDNQKLQNADETQLSFFKDQLSKTLDMVNEDYLAKVQEVPAILAKIAKTKQDEKKRLVQDRVLKFNQDAADRGDAYGLLRMGERYRDAEGVPKDLTKSRAYFTKAIAAGSTSADAELKALPTN